MRLNFFVSFMLIVTFSNADYLYIKRNTCVKDIIIHTTENKGFCWTRVSNDTQYCSKTALLDRHFFNGWHNVSGVCTQIKAPNALGMTFEEYNFMQALLANLAGFFLIFLAGFLFVLQGRR